jgi:2-polyprenyl-3-methyl-5-hydroxy-6-metoxy-1,4-benzoquinol methylase
MSTAPTQQDPQTALVERLFGATIGALELFSVHLGTTLGLYDALATPATPGELAQRAGIHERYAREWLEQQAVAGLLAVAEESDDSLLRRYELPAAHRAVLCDADDPDHVAPFAALLAGIGGVLPAVAEAYRSGGGVPYADYGAEFRHGQGGINRPAFRAELPGVWIPAIPDVDAALRAGAGAGAAARVADVGCGHGWAAVAVAEAYPGVRVDGIDLDPASIEDARAHARAAGVADRVSFSVRDASALDGPYDLVLLLEVLHDLARPVEALRGIRAALAPGGSLLVADERVADAFTAPGDEIERMMYGWSVTHCLPTQMTEAGSAAIGTVIRAETVHELGAAAGFRSVEELDVENDFFRLYRLQ